MIVDTKWARVVGLYGSDTLEARILDSDPLIGQGCVRTLFPAVTGL